MPTETQRRRVWLRQWSTKTLAELLTYLSAKKCRSCPYERRHTDHPQGAALLGCLTWHKFEAPRQRRFRDLGVVRSIATPVQLRDEWNGHWMALSLDAREELRPYADRASGLSDQQTERIAEVCFRSIVSQTVSEEEAYKVVLEFCNASDVLLCQAFCDLLAGGRLGDLRCCASPSCRGWFLASHARTKYCAPKCKETDRPERRRKRAEYMRRHRQIPALKLQS